MNRVTRQRPLPQRPAAPFEILIEEHRVIMQALAALERQVDTFQSGGSFHRLWFAQMVTFLQAFADRGHHGKEEALLFPVMEEDLGYSRRTGPIMVGDATGRTGPRCEVRFWPVVGQGTNERVL